MQCNIQTNESPGTKVWILWYMWTKVWKYLLCEMVKLRKDANYYYFLVIIIIILMLTGLIHLHCVNPGAPSYPTHQFCKHASMLTRSP